MLLYARLRGHVSASGPVRFPSSASAMSLFHRRRRADWLDAVKVGRYIRHDRPAALAERERTRSAWSRPSVTTIALARPPILCFT